MRTPCLLVAALAVLMIPGGEGASAQSPDAGAKPPPPPDVCDEARLLHHLARAGDASADHLKMIRDVERSLCVGLDEADHTKQIRYSNGNGARYPNGTWYYPSGNGARYPNGTWYYPNGNGARYPNGTWYYPSGNGALYPNGAHYAPDGSRTTATELFARVCAKDEALCKEGTDALRAASKELRPGVLFSYVWLAQPRK